MLHIVYVSRGVDVEFWVGHSANTHPHTCTNKDLCFLLKKKTLLVENAAGKLDLQRDTEQTGQMEGSLLNLTRGGNELQLSINVGLVKVSGRLETR